VDPSHLLQSNLALIEGIAMRVCRRAHVRDADAEDFVASVKLALVEDDYAILRKYEGRSSLSTYLTIVIERLMSDERMRTRGRWHPSAEAVRLGPAALLLEAIVRRDRRTIDDALPLLRSVDPAITRESAEAMLARLPERRPRPAAIPLDSAPPAALATGASADAGALESEARSVGERAARVVRATLASFALEDRAIVRFRFGLEMNVSDISRMLRLPQRPLYRRIESLLQKLRGALAEAGVKETEAGDLFERAAVDEFDFGLSDMENNGVRQSKPPKTATTTREST
jgi:RNA polymerase sigma factor (sigma-70 family)